MSDLNGKGSQPVPLAEQAPRQRPAVVLTFDAKGRPTNFRPAGSVAGTWPHTPWWLCVFYDPYERVNVWSHGVPGAMFLLLGLHTAVFGRAEWQGIVLFCLCAATTQLFSALTHIWPDNHYLEKLDHLGIAALIIGTPMSTTMALHPDYNFKVMYAALLALLACAFMRPLPRVIAFISGAVLIVGSHFKELWCSHLAVEMISYFFGAVCFLRNKGHQRWTGFSDHHLLHYFSTFSCCVHLHHLVNVCNAWPAWLQ